VRGGVFVNRAVFSVGLLVLLAAVACNQPVPPSIAPFFNALTPSGTTVPVNAQTISPEEFKRRVESGELTPRNPTKLEQLRQEAAQRFQADNTQIRELSKTNPRLLKIIDNKDPAARVLRDGNYALKIKDKNGIEFEVVTDGLARQYRRALESRAEFNDPANQRKVYTSGYNLLPENLRSGLPTPSSLSSASLQDLLSAREQLAAVLAKNPDTLEDAVSVASSPALRPQGVNPDAKPANYAATPDDEEGDGKGIDREGNCAFDDRSPNGLYQNFWWKQKFYATHVKSQGGRGTCVGFAVTAALESRIAIEQGRYVNLSEQFLWSKIAGQWDEREFEDGASTSDTADEWQDSGFKLPLENVWNYNKSRNRDGDDDEDSGDWLTMSCDNYNEFCSDTSAQMEYDCSFFGGQVFCGYYRPAATGEKFGMGDNENIYDWSSWSLPVDEMRAYLRNGYTMVAGLTVNIGFDNVPNHGFMVFQGGSQERGGHAVQVVGFVSAYNIINHPTLPQFIKNYAQDSGGGYFIIKNSWGYCYGDAGYVYIPIAWAEEYFSTVHIFKTTPSAAFKKVPNVPPTVQITAPQTGAQFNQEFNSITLKASATDPDGSIANIKWNSSLEGNLGTGANLTVSLSQIGEHKITATATDNQGATDSAEISITLKGNKPVVTIGAPSPNQALYINQAYPFEGSAVDGILDIACNKLVWTSSKAGEGPWNGCTPQVSFSSLGARTITLTATDDSNSSGTKTVAVTVINPPPSGPPDIQITYPTGDSNRDPFGKLRIGYTFTDPGGSNQSQYTVVWTAQKSRTVKTITPLNYAVGNVLLYKYFIPNEYFPGGLCAQYYSMTIKVKITDPEGLSATDSKTVQVVGAPC
jgi:C1A family cysteine protease